MTTVPKRAKFTKGYVDKVRPAAKDDFHWDTDVKGFGLRITPTGKITFIVQASRLLRCWMPSRKADSPLMWAGSSSTA